MTEMSAFVRSELFRRRYMYAQLYRPCRSTASVFGLPFRSFGLPFRVKFRSSIRLNCLKTRSTGLGSAVTSAQFVAEVRTVSDRRGMRQVRAPPAVFRVTVGSHHLCWRAGWPLTETAAFDTHPIGSTRTG